MGTLNPEDAKIYWQKANESLEVAEYCLDKGHYNNCASRSYYAAYQCMITVLSLTGQLKDSTKHETVISDFFNAYMNRSKTFIQFRDAILTLKGARTIADYKNSKTKKNDANRFL